MAQRPDPVGEQHRHPACHAFGFEAAGSNGRQAGFMDDGVWSHGDTPECYRWSGSQSGWVYALDDGGVKGGTSYGATDDFGRRAQENRTTIWEFYSTVLHILGLDYNQLSWYHNGLDRRLTDVHGHVIQDVLA